MDRDDKQREERADEAREDEKENIGAEDGRRRKGTSDATPDKLHCHKCGTLMENGVCPNCGYKIYVPMEESKTKKIRLIVGGVCLVLIVVWLIVKGIKG